MKRVSIKVLDAGDAAHVDVLGEDGLAAAVPDLGHPVHVAVGSVGQVIADLDGEEVEALLGVPKISSTLDLGMTTLPLCSVMTTDKKRSARTRWKMEM